MNRYLFGLVLVLGLAFGCYLALPQINKLIGLPSLENITEYQPISSIELFDYRDKFVGFLQGVEDRQVLTLSEISPYLRRAVLAIEDKSFYEHFGVDVAAIVRAFFSNIQAGRIVEGGSTITQQLVKNLLIPEKERTRTFTRKIKEVLLALELERKVNKDKILELYLNQVFWGNRAYGVQRGSQRYFDKSASELTLGEAAYLAGLLKAPSTLSANKKLGEERKKLVLQKLLEFGYITKKQYTAAIKERLSFRSSPGQFELYPYYFSYVLEELKERFDIKELREKGYKVFTGLDPDAQEKAERILNEEIKNAPKGVTQYALAAIDIKTGQVRALVGGVGEFWKHQWNRSTNPHTIGSAFKPFVYLTAFQEGLIDPDTLIKDSKIEIPDGLDMIWKPKNFDNKYWGTITVREALVFSRNLPAVKVARKVGIEKVIEVAKACGIETKLEPNLSLSLGSEAISPLEAASSYSTIARGGVYIKPILIRKIEDPKERIVEKNDPIPQRACSSDAVSILVNVLQDVVKRGTGALARLDDRPVAGKTGTSDKSRDVWFIGFTPDFCVAIWGGNDENQEIHGKGVTGGAIVARVWKRFCEAYYEDKDIPKGEFPGETRMKELLVDPLTGLLATPYTAHPVRKRFFPGTEPKQYAPIPPGAKRFRPFRLFAKPFLYERNRFEEEKQEEIASEDEEKLIEEEVKKEEKIQEPIEGEITKGPEEEATDELKTSEFEEEPPVPESIQEGGRKRFKLFKKQRKIDLEEEVVGP